MQSDDNIRNRVSQKSTAAERNPGEIAAPHCAQADDQLAPEQYQDKPVVPHWPSPQWNRHRQGWRRLRRQ
ncbi:hypothetical protein [Mesorhizobium sp. CA4]|uniref:hypothetical protein n=1 Tax=Mesorhizobium sp. CA4 TaxID=588499 RepID=UPI001CD0B250|nr:hypothetical protein [Mesorhizobium sp. CA4]MBZ9823155.1 hypothetical protein [Mesorhizobium sp. CA4]